MRKLLPVPEVGQTFGHLTVTDNAKFIGKRKASECRCSCGRTKTVRNEHLVKGLILSCGCLVRKVAADKHFKHGGKGTRLYRIWKGMRERCNNPNSCASKNYHSKGIRIEEVWNDFSAFREWAILHGYNDSLTIDRIDSNMGYSPQNCRWCDRAGQSENRSVTKRVVVDGKTTTLASLSKSTGIPYGTLYDRLSHGRPLTKKQRRTRK